MPDHHSPASPAIAPLPAVIDPSHLSREAALTVLGVPAVLRLEPTLRNALHRLHGTASRSQPGGGTVSAADGISLRRRGAAIDVHVDIAVSSQRSAHLTAAAVQVALRSHLTAQQLTPGTITVAVLTVEH